MVRLRRRALLQISLSVPALGSASISHAQASVEEADFDDVVSKYSGPDFAGLGPSDQIIVPPLFRYRFKFSVSGSIRPISERRKVAIAQWAKANRAPEFAEIFTDEVELLQGSTSLWLPWQRSLVEPFTTELRTGGEMSVRVLFIGAIKGELMFLSLGYQHLR